MTLEQESKRASLPSIGQLKLRPGERVRHYLLSEFEVSNLQDGTRLPSNKDIARRLNVSSLTVNSVLQQLAREGRIRARRGSGTFLIAPEASDPESLRIMIGSPIREMQEPDAWVDGILGNMLRSSFGSKPPVTFEGLSKEAWGTDSVVDELMAKRDAVSGLILLPFTLAPHQYSVVESYEGAGKPVVQIHPPHVNATANYVSPDYFHSCQLLGETWAATGRRRVMIIRNKTPFRNISSQLRHAGLIYGLGSKLGTSISLEELEMAPNITELDACSAMRQHLAHSDPPDAVFSANDSMALGSIRAFKEAGLHLPDDVSVVAGLGGDITGSAHPHTTRICIPLMQMGNRLLDLLLRRIALKGISLPAEILPSSFLPGDSTRPQENDGLAAAFSSNRNNFQPVPSHG
ncbi:MAG: substrate-binding domain-containing protein [Verrucomicrobiota bacterium]